MINYFFKLIAASRCFASYLHGFPVLGIDTLTVSKHST